MVHRFGHAIQCSQRYSAINSAIYFQQRDCKNTIFLMDAVTHPQNNNNLYAISTAPQCIPKYLKIQ